MLLLYIILLVSSTSERLIMLFVVPVYIGDLGFLKMLLILKTISDFNSTKHLFLIYLREGYKLLDPYVKEVIHFMEIKVIFSEHP